MNDKTLLELAAKAYGFGGGSFTWCDPVLRNDTNAVITDGGLWDYTDNRTLWNSLTNDGDALRLAVKLRIDFYISDDSGESAYAGYYKPDAGGLRKRFMIQRFDDSPSPYAATRRAIVRAAAAIAEQGEK